MNSGLKDSPAKDSGPRDNPPMASFTTKNGWQACWFLFVLSVIACVASFFGADGGILIAPLLGLFTIVVAIISRAWLAILLGILQILMPALTVYFAYALAAYGW